MTIYTYSNGAYIYTSLSVVMEHDFITVHVLYIIQSHTHIVQLHSVISRFFTDHFLKKLKEVINVPSIEWLQTSYVTGTRGSKWLLQTLLDINRLPKENSKVHTYSTAAEGNLAEGAKVAACAKDAYGVWLTDIMKPLQERILKVYIRICIYIVPHRMHI